MKQTTFRTLTVVGVMLAVIWTAGAAHGASIIWVTENTNGSSAPNPDDVAWTDLLTANGHSVTRRNNTALDAAKITEMNNADLVIVGRDGNSGSYTQGTEVADWNGVTSPLILMNQYISRNSRWKWVNNGSYNGTTADLHADDPGHVIFDNVTLDGSDNVDTLNTVGVPRHPRLDIAATNNGTVIGSPAGSTGQASIVLWDKGDLFYPTAGQTAGDKRMFFAAGNDDNNPKGALNLTAAGEQIFLDAVDFMASVTLISNHPITETWSNGVHWSDGNGAHAGVHYHVGDSTGKSLRTPHNVNNPTFPGDSLTIHSTGVIGFKHNGTVTIDDLRLDGGTISASTGNRTLGLAGNLDVLSDSTINLSNSGDTRDIELKSTLTGSGNLIVKGNSNYSILRFRSNTAGYTGAVVVEDSVDRLHMGHTAGNAVTVRGVGGGLDYGPFEEFDVGTEGGDAVVVCPAGQPVDLGTGGGSLSVSRRWTGNSTTRGTLDLSGASDVDINVTNLRLGIITSGSSASSKGIMKLSAAGANSVKATTITVGDSTAAGNTGVTSQLTLGGSTNALWADTMVVGGRKSKGTVDILAGGSVVLRNKAGTGRMDLYIGRNNINTGTNVVGVMDLTGGTFNAQLDELLLGRHQEGNGSGKGTLIFDAGTVDANTVVLGHASTGGATDSANPKNTQGTITMNGGSFHADSMTVGLNGAIGTFNANGGTVSVGAGSGDSLSVGRRTESVGTGTVTQSLSTMDVSGASSFTADVGTFGVGYVTGSGGGQTYPTGTVILSPNNTITADSIVLADSPSVGLGGKTNQITLGATNVVNVDTITIGGSKGVGVVDIAAGGVLTLGGKSGARADMFVGNQPVGTGGGSDGTADFSGGTINAMLDDLVIAQKVSDAVGTTRGTFTMSAGTVDVNNILMANRIGGGGGTAIATFNLQGGTLKAGTIDDGGNGGTANFNFTGGQLEAGTVGFALTQAGGTTAPGGTGAIGTTSVLGGYTQNDGVLEIEFAGDGVNDVLMVDGPVNLANPDAEFDLLFLGGYDPLETDGWIILDNVNDDPIAGYFTAMDGTALTEGTIFRVPGASYPLQITYFGGTGRDVALTAVPEPATMLALLAATAGLGGYVRRRRRA